ncbi:MAG: monovalent cation/H(+) antiporter subunit G [Planctomycetota bacterium]|nr:monovalent cation/H(+) antiporter subunit G [Planctomycetota bacterium]MDA1141714.1 monovalent cation/H(+) antiporter subunit G [Planctomycetota bacterium]
MIHFNELGVGVRGLLVIAFLFLTAPIAAHMIGRVAYFVGLPPWEGTKVDEIHGHYNQQSHVLSSQPLPKGVFIDESNNSEGTDQESQHDH